MGQRLLSFNCSGIIFISRADAEVIANLFDLYENPVQHREILKLKPPLAVLSRWSDDRVVATFLSDIRPGHVITPTISYTGGFYDQKKDPWPVIWSDKRIKQLVIKTIEQLCVDAGFFIGNSPLDLFDNHP